MNILLFGGNSQRNKDWIHEVGKLLEPEFDKCVVHDYEHWDGKGEFIDFDLELSRLPDEVAELGDYVVFAKSVGSVLSLKAISQGILKPIKCVFVGLPIKLAEEDNIPLDELLKDNKTPTLIMQNTTDPVASYKKVKSYIEESKLDNYTLLELEGDTHSYDDFKIMKSQIESFVS
ncbi:hypothetical protein H6800_03510 [Candidatus Nomurabacteria bacterium]|nr:hypothetical protein [Candidatus Nomurabacteria bacterium]